MSDGAKTARRRGAARPPARIAYLDGPRLQRAILAGVDPVVADTDLLNRINVFPVPDGDTGTNLAHTVTAIGSALANHRDRHAGRTLAVIADAALDGARGNAGAILAEFFQGMSDACTDLRLLTTENFVAAAAEGARYAREAISEPREGTILTVLSDFADELTRRMQEQGAHDFEPLLRHGLERAERSLAMTTELLEPLRKAGVVDAGARGFVDLLRGVQQYIQQGSVRALPEIAEPVPDVVPAAVELDAGSAYRYCIECTVTASAIDRRRMREQLSALGDSLVLAGTRGKLRLHLHADRPARVFELAQRYGTVTGRKADDMHAQRRSALARDREVAIATDTAADIPDEELERLGIHVVPVRIHFGEQSFLDKITISTAELYARLRSDPVHPSTSQPAPGDLRRLYAFLASHYGTVISLHVSGKSSGTLQAAQTAAMRTEAAGAVLALDSRNVSLGQGLIVMYAAECAASGYSADEVLLAIDEIIPRTRSFAMLRDLTYAVRGGRVPRSRKWIADLLRLTPLLATQPDGRVASGGVLLGRRRAVAGFARHLQRRLDPRLQYRLAVGHADCQAEAEDLLARLRTALPRLESSFAMEIGTALGVHGGPGCLVVAAQEYTPPEKRGSPPAS